MVIEDWKQGYNFGKTGKGPGHIHGINAQKRTLMLIRNAIVVIIGAGILSIGLIYALSIIKMLKDFNLARPWIMLTTLISFFFIGYVFTALKFLGIDLMPGLSLENLVTAIFFFGAVFVLVLAILNRTLLANIFGIGLSDSKALKLFSEHINIPARQIIPLIKPEYFVTCDICHQSVKYSIPDIVRAHPRLERGVIVDRGMGGVNYRLFIRHYCGKEYREIPVRHDSQFEYRSQGPSRIV